MYKPCELRKQLPSVDLSEFTEEINCLKGFLEDTNYAEKTVIEYLSQLRIFLAWVKTCRSKTSFKDVTYDDMRRYLRWQRDENGIEPRTENDIIATFIKAFVSIRNENWNFHQLSYRRYDVYLPKVPTNDEVALLLNSPIPVQQKLIISIMASSGLRISEVAELKYKDIERKIGIIHVAPGKSRMERNTLLSQTTLQYLADYYWYIVRTQNRRPGTEDYIFATRAGAPLPVYKLRSEVKKALVACNLQGKGYCCHSFRHFFGLSVYLSPDPRLRYNLALLRQLLGHKTLAATEVYVNLAAARCFAVDGIANPLDSMLKQGGGNG